VGMYIRRNKAKCFYWQSIGCNESQTITIVYYVVDDFGDLVEVGRIVKPWEFNQ
jgi:hypothetical protein